MIDSTFLEEELLRIASARAPDKTACPSEAARAIAGDHPDNWGALMQPLRRAAVRLAEAGRLVLYRKGRVVDPRELRGIYRIGLPRHD
jgi:hypothetical protein